MKIPFHKIMLYLLIRFYPELFDRYMNEYLELGFRFRRQR